MESTMEAIVWALRLRIEGYGSGPEGGSYPLLQATGRLL